MTLMSSPRRTAPPSLAYAEHSTEPYIGDITDEVSAENQENQETLQQNIERLNQEILTLKRDEKRRALFAYLGHSLTLLWLATFSLTIIVKLNTLLDL